MIRLQEVIIVCVLFLIDNFMVSNILPSGLPNYLSDESKNSKPEKPSSAAGAGLPNPFDFSSMSSLLNVSSVAVSLICFVRYLCFRSLIFFLPAESHSYSFIC